MYLGKRGEWPMKSRFLGALLLAVLWAGSAKAADITTGKTVWPDPAERMRTLVPAHLLPFFDLYLYVNKAEDGYFAQHMLLFEVEGGTFRLIDKKAVSTGRERRERHVTTTPTGLFKLDPRRAHRHYRSATWGAAMPYAIFFEYEYATRPSGLAIHAAVSSNVHRLGSRDSAGCIRLAPHHARALFERITSRHRGLVPRFAFDEEGGTTSREGQVVLDEHGAPELDWGFTVLLVIDERKG
jgi:hypothetical protein